MKNLLKIAFNLPLYSTYDYISQVTNSDIKIGMRVEAPFGRKKIIGIISEITNIDVSSKSKYKLKNIYSILDNEPIITKDLMKICKWASNYYQYPLGQVYFSCIPTKLRKNIIVNVTDSRSFFYEITEKRVNDYFKNKSAQKRIYEAIKSKIKVKSKEIKLSNPLKLLLQNGFIKKSFSYFPEKVVDEINLNEEQARAYKAINNKINKFSPSLIEGVTGSGKTELYIKVIQKILLSGSQSLVIVPEINLIPQIVKRFRKYLNCNISEYHSSITENNKYNIWKESGNGKIDIVIGTRSAVFLPFKALKIIIIDEEHDVSLKQSEKFRYHARDLSLVRSKNLNIPILMGSATPSFESLHNCDIGKYNHIILKKRFFNTKLPAVKVVDASRDTVTDGFSSELIRSIKNELNLNKQVLLFVGRRGYSHALLCKICGWTSKCFKCDAHMTFHKNENILWCHHCGYKKKININDICACKSESEIVPLGTGTERVETKCKSLFPNANIIRIDSDTINNITKLRDFIKKTQSKEIDILVGTQMLTKGHDFPDLNLVGIIDIDAGLYSLDFRGLEKIGQMIIQVAGRSGRHNSQGKLIIQTRKPDNILLNELLNHGYNKFAKKAMLERNQSSFPPYSYLSLFRVSSVNKGEGLSFLMKVKNNFSNNTVNLLGPAPAPILKKNNRYYYQLLVNARNRKSLLQKSSEIREYIIKQKKSNIRWSIDIDPIDLY
jgi:primosomal protein N' (replication factor Y)